MIMPGRAACASRSQCASFSACQMPLKSGLPSAVRGTAAACGAGGSPVRNTAAAASAPMTAATSAVVIVLPVEEAAIVSLLSGERIDLFAGVGEPSREPTAPGAAQRRRIRSASLSERPIFGARTREQRGHAVITLVAARFLVVAIRLVRLLGVLLRHRPRLGPRRGIVDRDGELDGVRVLAFPPLD